MDRRTFLKIALATSVASNIRTIGEALASDPTREIPRRALGQTGERVSIVGIGGFHLGQASSDDEATRIVRTAVDHGVHLDLLQIHEVIRMEDPPRVFRPGGAIEALVEAKQAGKIRFIGFTGHKSPDIHLSMLKTADDQGFRFDTVQMPLNVMDAHTHGFEKRVLPVLTKKNIGVLGMKPMGSGIILKSGAVEAPECLRYAMSLPTSVVITGCDSIAILDQALAVASGFRPLDVAARERILAKTAAVAKGEQYELYKTTTHFDGTTHHPSWLG